MTQNLEIENKTLTPADSDVATEFELPASIDNPNSSNSYESKEIYIDKNYGGYYTWYTTTAGEGTQHISSDMPHSICPKGWRMPTRTDFIELDKALGGTGQNMQQASTTTLPNKYMSPPNNFKMGGNFTGGIFYNTSSYAYYWSSTGTSPYDAYYLYVAPTFVYPQQHSSKIMLNSVRCVSRQ